MSFKIVLGVSCCCDMNFSDYCHCGKTVDGNFDRVTKILFTGDKEQSIIVYNNYIESRDQTKGYQDEIYAKNGWISLRDENENVILSKDINVLPLPDNYDSLQEINKADSDSDSDNDSDSDRYSQ